MKRGSLLVLVVVGLMALPEEASANAGTPLMWAGMIHLVIGNALVGLLEGFLLGWWFGVPRAKAVGAMIVANCRITRLFCEGLVGRIMKHQTRWQEVDCQLKEPEQPNSWRLASLCETPIRVP